MLVVHDNCVEYFAEVMKFAAQRNILWDRGGLLKVLADRAEHGVASAKEKGLLHRHVLLKDFADWSFRFLVQESKDGGETWEHRYNGGIIYEGPGQPLDGSAPACTVKLGEHYEGWSVHT